MAYSFLIHAGDDKARLAPIVRQLIAEGVSLWIDDPYHVDLGLTRPEIQKLHGYIVPGTDWPRQRDAALQEASSILIGVSEACLQPTRSQVRAELAIADFRELNQGIPVLPLTLSAAELAGAAPLIGRRQSFKTYVEAGEEGFVLTARGGRAMEELLDALREANSAKAPELPARSKPLELASPYFADRTPQRQDLGSALIRAREDSARPRILPFVTGTYEDRPDKFALSQLPHRLLPRVMRVEGCEAIPVAWPYCASSAPDRAIDILSYEIADLDPLPQAAVIYSQPPPDQLVSAEAVRACLILWCRFWDSPAVHGRLDGCLPILDLRISRAASPFVGRWFGSSAFRLERHLDLIASEVAADFQRLRLLPLAPLAPVTWNCVEDWLREEVAPVLGEHRTSRYRSLLHRYFDHGGMNMERWAHRAHEIFSGLERIGR